MEVSAQLLLLAIQETNTLLAKRGTAPLAAILYLKDLGLRINPRDILDRFRKLVGTHTMCQIRNTLITCTFL